jgi:hypothetical protein
MDGISFSHCLGQIAKHLASDTARYRSGSGDAGIVLLDALIRQSWPHPQGPFTKIPDFIEELAEPGTPLGPFTDSTGCFVDPPPEAVPRTQQGMKPIEKAIGFLHRELATGASRRGKPVARALVLWGTTSPRSVGDNEPVLGATTWPI